MRKQYHFRKVENDTLIWDVDHLVMMTKQFEVKEISLKDIRELDEPYWYPDRHPSTQEIIDHLKLIQEADLSYPIILCAQGKLMDGMHRVCKAKLLGMQSIHYVQFTTDPKPDFINIHEDDLIYDD